jgi:hypothetical protein
MVQKHIWLHDMQVVEEDGDYMVEKEIYNWYDNSIELSTRKVDFSRTS